LEQGGANDVTFIVASVGRDASADNRRLARS
jgi:hypothetical protein